MALQIGKRLITNRSANRLKVDMFDSSSTAVTVVLSGSVVRTLDLQLSRRWFESRS